MATAEERARIAAALAEARKARGLSQASLALLVGVTKGCVGNWESATASPASDVEPGYGSHLDRDNDGVGCE